MRTTICIFIFLFACPSGFGQSSKVIDSLQALLNSNIADTLKVRTLYKLSDTKIPFSEQLAYVERGVKLSDRIGFQNGRFEGVFKQSFKNSTFGSWAKGLEMAFLGYYEALKLKNIDQEVNFLNMIAMSYQKQKNYKKALYWSNRAVRKIERGYKGNGANIWAAYHQTASFYAELNLPDSAIFCADKSIEAGINAKIPPSMLGYSYEYKGDAYVKKKAYDLALKNYNIAIEYLKEDPFSVQEVERQIAQMYMLTNNLPLAEKYALQAYHGALNTTNPNVLVDVCEILVRIYEPVNKEKAYPFLKTYQTMSDSLFHQEHYNQVYQIELNDRLTCSKIALQKNGPKTRIL
jgi:tetratricopeptide (TPR) repeat protein